MPVLFKVRRTHYPLTIATFSYRSRVRMFTPLTTGYGFVFGIHRKDKSARVNGSRAWVRTTLR